MKAFSRLNSYKGECRFSTWLYRIAYNVAISATRKTKREFSYIEENTINESTPKSLTFLNPPLFCKLFTKADIDYQLFAK